jgi:hypothetical protein
MSEGSNPKSQAPNPNHSQIPTSKGEAGISIGSGGWILAVGIWLEDLAVGIWLGDLAVGSGWDLELGAWDLT